MSDTAARARTNEDLLTEFYVSAQVSGEHDEFDLSPRANEIRAELLRRLAQSAAPVEEVIAHERQRAVEICDLTLPSMIDRDACARAIRNPESKYPSKNRQHGYGALWATKLREWFKSFMPAGTKVTDPQKFGEFLIEMASHDGDDLQLMANDFMEAGAQGQGVGPRFLDWVRKKYPVLQNPILLNYGDSLTSDNMNGIDCATIVEEYAAQFFSPVPSPESGTKEGK